MYILVDVGGTKTRIAGTRDLKEFGTPVIFETPRTCVEGLQKIADVARECAAGEPIEKMVVGIPGTHSKDHRTTYITGAGTLGGWSKQNIAEDLEQRLSTSVVMENDTALVGLGEAHHGAGRGSDIMCYFTISTGVGGVRIVDGMIEKMAHGAEMGGQYLSVLATQTLEQMVSGSGVEKKYGMHPVELGKDSPVWEELAGILAIGIYNSLLHWSPERVVLGGSMMREVGISIDRVRAHVEKINVKLPELPEFKHSELGDLGGLWGGMARLRQLGH